MGKLSQQSTEVWEAVVIPQVLSDYVDLKRSELPQKNGSTHLLQDLIIITIVKIFGYIHGQT